jgi:hypothetical protein
MPILMWNVSRISESTLLPSRNQFKCKTTRNPLITSTKYVDPNAALQTLNLDKKLLSSLTPANGSLPELLIPTMTANYKFKHNLPQAWLASRPGHPFWLHALAAIVKKSVGDMKYVEGTSGPVLVYEAYKGYMYHRLKSPNEFPPVHLVKPGNFS